MDYASSREWEGEDQGCAQREAWASNTLPKPSEIKRRRISIAIGGTIATPQADYGGQGEARCGQLPWDPTAIEGIGASAAGDETSHLAPRP